MHKWFSKFLLILGLAAISSLTVHPAFAQAGDEKEKPPVYTYVAEWAVPRAEWPAYEKANLATKQLMEKLQADGTIVNYGWFKNLVHSEGTPTHGEWWSASSVGNLMKALAVISGQTGAAADDQAKILVQSRHWDRVFVTRNYANHSGAFENGYLRVGSYKTKPGETEAVDKVLKAYIIPIAEKLLADGDIHSYGIYREAIHTDDPGDFSVVVITNGAAGLDKFYAALEAAGKANPTGGPAFGAATVGEAHRDTLSLTSGAFK
jgi:hypothetical protein